MQGSIVPVADAALPDALDIDLNWRENMEIIIGLWLLGLSVWDARYCRVPVWLMCSGGLVLAAAVILGNGISGWPAWSEAEVLSRFVVCLSGMLPGAALVILALCTGAIGYGDGIVVAFLGLYLGFGEVLLLLTISLFVMSLCSLVLLLLKKVRKNTHLPYLPFLTLAWGMLCLF